MSYKLRRSKDSYYPKRDLHLRFLRDEGWIETQIISPVTFRILWNIFLWGRDIIKDPIWEAAMLKDILCGDLRALYRVKTLSLYFPERTEAENFLQEFPDLDASIIEENYKVDQGD